MASFPFKKLPPELICKIYVELDGIGDVLRLARASQSFNEVWRDNARSVCSAIMPRSIPCFQDAEALLRAQEQQIGSQIQDVSIEDISQSATISARRFCENASTVARACDIFENSTRPPSP